MKNKILFGAVLLLLGLLMAEAGLATQYFDFYSDTVNNFEQAKLQGYVVNITLSAGTPPYYFDGINVTVAGDKPITDIWVYYRANETFLGSCNPSGAYCNLSAFNIRAYPGTQYNIVAGRNGSTYDSHFGACGLVFPWVRTYSNIISQASWDGSWTYVGNCDYNINGIVLRDTTVAPGGNTITVTLNNMVNGTLIPGFCVNISGNGTYYNCTSTTSLSVINMTGLLTFDFSNITGGAPAPEFFNTSNQSVITGDTSIVGQTFQAWLNVSAEQLFTSNSISTFNATNDKVRNTTSAGWVLVPANNASNALKFDIPGNFSKNATCIAAQPLTITSCTVAGIYDDNFRINATDSLNGQPVTTFNVTVTNSTLGGQLYNQATTNGSIIFPVLQGYSYNFLIDAVGYSYANQTQPANASSQFYQFTLLPQNSIFLYFFDEETLAAILQNVTVEYNNGSVSFTNTSATGEMIRSNLNAGTWTITAESDGYETRQYYVTVTDRSAQDVDVYLLNSSSAQITTITIKDADTADVVPGAVVTMQQQVAGNWVTIDQATSDIFGVTRFELVNGKQYRVLVEATGYATKQGEFVVTTTSYIIVISTADTQSFITYGQEFSYSISPNNVSNAPTNFTLTVSSPTGAMDWFAVVVTVNGTTSTQNVTSSPSGGTAQVSLDLTPFNNQMVRADYYMKSVSFDDPLIISRNWYIYGFTEGNYTLSGFMTYYADDSNGLSLVSRGILITVGAVILGALLGFIFGAGAAVIGASAVFIVGAFYGWIHWTIISVVVGGLIAALFLTGRGR